MDNCREGFIQGLEEEGLVEGENLKIKVSNADSDTGTAAQIADTFVADKVDLICAIATPSAQAAYNSARNTDIPVVYTAVTNPEEAQLADDEGMPVGAVTGTSDQLPVEAQLAMIREILPDAKTMLRPSVSSILPARLIPLTALPSMRNTQRNMVLPWRPQELPILQKFPWQQPVFWIR